MRARYLLVGSISICLFSGNDGAYAQDTPGNAPGNVQNLPPVVVTGTKPGVKRGRDQSATRRVHIPTAQVYPVSPLPSVDSDADKVPASD